MSSEPQTNNLQPTPVTFYGSHSRKVDAKGRFHLPFQFRADKGDQDQGEGLNHEDYMISPGPHGSVALTPLSVWLRRFNTKREDQSLDEFLTNQRLMSRHSHPVSPDKQGRIALPSKVQRALKVDKEIVIVGMGLNMELWAPEPDSEGEAEVQAPSSEYLLDFFG